MNLKCDLPDLVTFKSFSTPPGSTFNVMSAVCVLLYDEVPSQQKCKIHFSDPRKLKKMVEEYDARQVTPSMKVKLKEFVEHPEFSPEKQLKYSKAASALCEWVLAMYSAN